MIRAAILGCAGEGLSRDERAFFSAAQPLGFILFARNCQDPAQVSALVAECRDSVGRSDAPVLIDQEGGRVARLRPPYWREAPAPAVFGRLARTDIEQAEEAARLNARLLAEDLRLLGITVDCTPLLDLLMPGAHSVIGDRAFGKDVGTVARLGRAVVEGLLAGGVIPVVKHVPGHGRAGADSHLSLPVVDTSAAILTETDFVPFAALADAPWGMTAHIVYSALDGERPATASPRIIKDTIRGQIGFDGVLVSDDLSMKALAGDFTERADSALAAGCDLVLHCNGDLVEMRSVMEGTAELTPAAAARVERAEALRLASYESDFDAAAARHRLDALLSAV